MGARASRVELLMPLPEAEPASEFQVPPLNSRSSTWLIPATLLRPGDGDLGPFGRHRQVLDAGGRTRDAGAGRGAGAKRDPAPPVNCLTKTLATPVEESSQATTGPPAVSDDRRAVRRAVAAYAAGTERRAERHPAPVAAVGRGVVDRATSMSLLPLVNCVQATSGLPAASSVMLGPACIAGRAADAVALGTAGKLLPAGGRVQGDVDCEVAGSLIGPGDVLAGGAGDDARFDGDAGQAAEAGGACGAGQFGPAAEAVDAARQRWPGRQGACYRAKRRDRVGQGWSSGKHSSNCCRSARRLSRGRSGYLPPPLSVTTLWPPGPASRMSLPLPPVMVLWPPWPQACNVPWPLIVAPPPAGPTIVSKPAPAENVPPVPLPPCRTLVPAPTVIETVSGPPWKVLSPSPAWRTSGPVPATIVLLPAPPSRRLAAGPPKIRSSPAPPSIDVLPLPAYRVSSPASP